MEEKKSFGDKLEAFFAGKGFYAVLFLCVAVIGVSAWSMLSGSQEGALSDGDVSLADSPIDDDTIMTGLTEYPVITETIVKPDDAEQTIAEAPPEVEVAAPIDAAAAEQPQESAEQNAASYFIWPVVGEIETAYSMDALIYNKTMADWRTHDGIDIACDIGCTVQSAGDGTVESVYADDLYGTTVVISHGNGIRSIYSNLAAEPTVSEGDAVTAGQTIGSVGTTAICEASVAAHLHFSMSKSDSSINPLDYLS